MKITKIVSNFLESNTFILEKDNEIVIIDCGCELDVIKKQVCNKKVVGVLLTHGHYDHSLFSQEYAKEFGCKVYASQWAKEILSDGEANYSEGKFVVNDFSNFVCVEDSQELQLGEFDVVAFETKGHSKDCMCFMVDGTLFAGDTLFEKGIGRTDLIGSSKDEMLATLEKLEKVNFETCYSGHGDSSTKEEQQTNIALFKRFLLRRK
ncbi:MAG: MBL fold metallo-hydrolase [Clostridia bacterium]|nr:MBL fold metallo-hydrolase [Clostridia bacterium]